MDGKQPLAVFEAAKTAWEHLKADSQKTHCMLILLLHLWDVDMQTE